MASSGPSLDRLCISDERSFEGGEKKIRLPRRILHREPGKKKHIVTMADEVSDTDKNTRQRHQEFLEKTFGRGRVRMWDFLNNHITCFLSEAEREILEGMKEVKRVRPANDECYREVEMICSGTVRKPINVVWRVSPPL